ncbi:MAG TPA: hypothetical protein VGM76_03755 [Lacipirellulaceae bacterium]
MNAIVCWTAALVSALLGRSLPAQSLDGTWEISGVVDDGRVIDPANIRLMYAADGRVTISGQTVQLVVPITYQRKQLPFVADTSSSPAQFNIAGTEKTGGRGIFLYGKDSLVLCIASRDKDRPTSFVSLPGSGNLLVTLTRATDNDPYHPPTQPNSPASYQDDQIRSILIGTWGHQDADAIHYFTFNGDGSMAATTVWKDNFKKMFHQDVQSSGTWKVADGVVIATLAQSTDAERRGQVSSFRIRSVSGNELVAVDADGEVRQEWKTP